MSTLLTVGVRGFVGAEVFGPWLSIAAGCGPAGVWLACSVAAGSRAADGFLYWSSCFVGTHVILNIVRICR